MKILVYGMQSSGASLITYFLAQNLQSLGVLDLSSMSQAPVLKWTWAKDVVVKCVITKKHSFQEHVQSFRPDKTVLVLRHPCHNYVSLKDKKYSGWAGSIEEKFEILEKVAQQKEIFDLVVHYEDFIFSPEKVITDLKEIGIQVETSFLNFKRTKQMIASFNLQHSLWSLLNARRTLSKFGNIDFSRIPNLERVFKTINAADQCKVRKLCPSLYKSYSKIGESRRPFVSVPK